MKRAMEIITKPKFIINKEAKMANNSQLAFIISQAMFIGEVYGLNKNKEDFKKHLIQTGSAHWELVFLLLKV